MALQPVVLFFDTETTGLPLCSSAGFKMHNNWPDVVQLAYSTSDSEEIVCEYIKPSKPIHPEASKVFILNRDVYFEAVFCVQ